MAQLESVEIEGLDIEINDTPDPEDDDAIATALLEAYRCYKRGGQEKAAASHAVDAVNMLADQYGINCGAEL